MGEAGPETLGLRPGSIYMLQGDRPQRVSVMTGLSDGAFTEVHGEGCRPTRSWSWGSRCRRAGTISSLRPAWVGSGRVRVAAAAVVGAGTPMNVGSLFLLGLQALTRNRMRTGLTTLGIVIGVAAVIATLAIGQGAREAVQAQIRALGANTLMVIPGTMHDAAARGAAWARSRR